MVELKNINKSYGNLDIFKDFNISFKENTITCILGISGSGKTTLLNILSNLTEFKGEIIKQGEDVSYIFQSPRLAPNLTVYKNIDLILSHKEKDKLKRQEIINHMLDTVELLDWADKYPYQLSGGMAQRVAMARAFSYKSSLLLMDEPFKGLDIGLKDRLIKAFLKLWEEDKRTTVYVTHDINEALMISDRIIIIENQPATIVYDMTIDAEKISRTINQDTMVKLSLDIYSKMVKDTTASNKL